MATDATRTRIAALRGPYALTETIRGRPDRDRAELRDLREELAALRAELEEDLAVLYPFARQFEFLSREFGPATNQCAMAMLARLARMERRLNSGGEVA